MQQVENDELSVSTHASVRRRQRKNGSWMRYAGFNSRLREEATLLYDLLEARLEVSTHASVRRRPVALRKTITDMEFQLTPP